MDKQKQIEEMAKVIRQILKERTDICYIPDLGKPIAEELYNAGYRKIPENAVVLTGTKAEEHFVDLLTEFDEMGFHPETTVPYPMVYADEWKRRMLYAIGQLRKETAEKFSKMAKARLNEWLEDNEDDDGKIDFGIAEIELIGVKSLDGEIIAESLIEEICKEITEGK